jgi:hypothetical protein
MRQLNVLIAILLIVAALVLYFTVPAAVLVGNDPTVDDVKAGLAMNSGWRCLGSPSPMFRIHRSASKVGSMGELRETLQLRCYLGKDDDFATKLTGEDFREQVSAAYGDGLNRALQSAIFDHNLKALSVALHVKGKTLCYFAAVNQWTQCNGQRSCIRGACKNREWLELTNE